MTNSIAAPFELSHHHVFLGPGHEQNERKTWIVIALCTAMMVVEIVGGNLFGSLALVADGLHMSTHAGAMLIAAIAYTYARKHANDPRFVFGTGKLGDLAGFTSAIVLAMIAILIGYEAVSRLVSPVPIHFGEALPIAVVGLVVNIVSAWLLQGGDHHGHSHGSKSLEGHDEHGDETKDIVTPIGTLSLSVFEDGVPPVFRIGTAGAHGAIAPVDVSVTTIREDGARQVFSFALAGTFLESTASIPEPHQFKAVVRLGGADFETAFEEHHHDHHGSGDHRDHNMRAAYIHVLADAAVSVLAIIGLLLAKTFHWVWMDPLAGIVGALVIANWSWGLIRDTGAVLVDTAPTGTLPSQVRRTIEAAGDELTDLHVWRLGPGHFGAAISLVTADAQRGPAYYHQALRRLAGMSHLTVEVHPRPVSSPGP